MSVNLRDRLFNDTGGVVQGATVQAVLVTGGGTDAGTGAVVQQTTATDVNGVWKFTGLPDPGVGNWYDVKIINGNQVRWRYGNIEAGVSAIALSASFTVQAGNTWDFSAGSVVLPSGVSAADPKITGQVNKGTGTFNLPTVVGNTGKWRYTKAFGGTWVVTPATGEALIAPGATAASAANATYTSPNGESVGWYCDGTNWMGI